MSTTHPHSTHWTVREALAQDEGALLTLFREAFGSDMSPQWWRLKYGAAHSHGLLVEQDGTAVAYYGGMARTVRFEGRAVRAVQIGDVMVAPALRGLFTRRGGPFYAAATGFIQRWLGTSPEYAFAYGFPSRRHCRLGELLGLYRAVDRIDELQWGPLESGSSWLTTLEPLNETHAPQVQSLWQHMADDLAHLAVGTRDFATLWQRYCLHPVYTYHVLLLRRRWTRQALGLLVLRQQAQGTVELLDVVGPRAHWPLLVRQARQHITQWGGQRLTAWATPAVCEALGQEALARQTTDVVIPTIVWQQAPEVLRLQQRWWLMGGDTDFR